MFVEAQATPPPAVFHESFKKTFCLKHLRNIQNICKHLLFLKLLLFTKNKMEQSLKPGHKTSRLSTTYSLL